MDYCPKTGSIEGILATPPLTRTMANLAEVAQNKALRCSGWLRMAQAKAATAQLRKRKRK
jgi:hypothetical protein